MRSERVYASAESGHAFNSALRCVAHEADEIVDSDDVALRAAAMRKRGRVAGFGIAALGTGAVNVQQLVGA